MTPRLNPLLLAEATTRPTLQTMTTATINPNRDWAAEQTVAFQPFIRNVVRSLRLAMSEDDLTQEASIRVFRDLQRYDESKGSSVKSWVFKSAWGGALDAARCSRFLSGGRKRKSRERISSLNATAYKDRVGKEITFAHLLEDREHVAALDMDFWRKTLKGSNQRERLTVLSYFVLGEPQEQIAESLGLSPSRVSLMLNAWLKRQQGIGT